MTVTARHTRPEEGVRFEMPDGAHIVKASAEETGGAFEVFEVEAPAAPSAPLHRSPWTGAIYLLEGSLRIRFEDGQVDVTPGSSITIPGETAFTFDVLSESARFLAVTGGTGLASSSRTSRRACRLVGLSRRSFHRSRP